ncbi:MULTISPECIES: hypothetical protein [unclassified Acinetobacter]|uniref:hypothetical protein n=1 Tax=unclassified Acinetobacter TaxID=196816 RepID=UPI00190E3704|nr:MULTISPECIES: hypothetical protein [unclassified Acinetobacter]MBK0062688.1 hypothetical protein [Acinetobacter sp. S55]MBK0065735.1 hypothetical protein [Acinetobacter sp. S54]
MLDFWYSERCTRGMKLGSCIAICAIIYFLSQIQKLTPGFTISCLGIGVITHFIQYSFQRIDPNNPYRNGFKILETVFPVMGLILIILLLPKTQKIVLALQALSFSALGLFVVSIYQNRAQR